MALIVLVRNVSIGSKRKPVALVIESIDVGNPLLRRNETILMPGEEVEKIITKMGELRIRETELNERHGDAI